MIIKKLITTITACVLGLSVATATPVVATSSPAMPLTTFGVDAAILTGCANAEDGSGSGQGILCVLRLVINIMTIGVGILGVIGITISGIQYLTAGGSEEQTRKAKRRIFEIVLGLAVYAISYLLLQFFLPGFSGIPGA